MDYIEQQIINAGVFNLENGIMCNFQVEDWLRSESVPAFSIDRLAKEIRETYVERRPLY